MHCSNYILPFATINDYKLYQILNGSNCHYDSSSDINSPKTYSALKTPKYLSNFFYEFNNFYLQHNQDNWKTITCKYCDNDEIQTLNKLNHK